MKKFSLSVVTVLAMSAFAVAGGDIEPVVEPVVVEVGMDSQAVSLPAIFGGLTMIFFSV